MALPRPACLRVALGRTTVRRVGAQTRSNAFRQGGRRSYASGHEAKKSSDLPWIIGSSAVTIPAAVWLYGQAPQKSDHHGETEPKVVEEDGGEEEGGDEKKEDEGDADGKDDSKDDSTDDAESKDDGKKDKKKDAGKKDDKSDESKDDGKSDDSDSDDDSKDTPATSDDDSADEEGDDKPREGAPGQINKLGGSKGQKPRGKTETKGEKDSQSTFSGAQHPYLSEGGKSEKMPGLKETAKIHGTVDPTSKTSKKLDGRE